MNFNLNNPNPDDLIDLLQDLATQAADNPKRTIFHSIGKFKERDQAMMADNIKDLVSTIKMIVQRSGLEDSLKFEVVALKDFGWVNDTLFDSEQNTEDKQWFTENFIKVRRL